MKIHDDEDRDDAPDLPARDVLDAWTVPAVGADLTDRVLGHVEAASSAEVVSMQERRRGGYGLALVGVAMVAAAALVLGLVQLWQTGTGRRDQPAAVAAPIVVRVPVPVPAPPVVEPPVVEPPVVERAPVDDPVVAPTVPELEDPSAGKQSAKGSEASDPFAGSHGTKAKPSRADETKAKPAVLRIGTMYGYGPAKVFVDGKAKGTTPVMNVKVTPGRHTVKWVWADGESHEVVVTLEAGETRVLKGSTGDPKEPDRER